ncbi:MAG: hypothetical protein J1E60_00065 [Christensenellaceae bacterium]|nr:hypothetical protein [Christensenellaceae bacterium]
MSKKTKTLELQLTQCMQENDALRTSLAETERQLNESKDELGKAMLELSNAKRKLDDFRVRQEAIVNALTEAHNTRERIIKEAKAEADSIEAAASSRKAAMLNEAKSALEHARTESAGIIQAANSEAENIRSEAKRDAQQMGDEALDEANDIVEMAKSQAQDIMTQAERVVSEQREQLNKLNTELRVRARLVLEQSEMYANILQTVADSESAEELQKAHSRENGEKDSGSSASDQQEESDNADDECDPDAACAKKNYETKPGQEAVCSKVPPCGRNAPCCAAKSDVDRANAPTNADFSKQEHTVKEGETDLAVTDATLEADDEATMRESSDDSSDSTALDSNLPEEYDSVSALMRNIYNIEGRELPDVENEPYDIGEGTPLIIDRDEEDEQSEPLPVDLDLDEILNEVLSDRN